MSKEGVNFAVAVEEGVSCTLVLYLCGEGEPILTLPLKEEEKTGDIYTVFIERLEPASYEYIYLLDNEVYLDPYAKRIVGREVWGQLTEKTKLRAAFDFAEFDWENDKPLAIPYHEVIMYSLHVRGFTKHSSSKVKNKGYFEGVVEKIPYLKELGVNQIELMPAYEFDEIMPQQENNMEYIQFSEDKPYRINYWGYSKANYFAPKASYSQNTDCIYSFKNMVKELHKNGIEVVMEFYFPAGTNPNLILDCVKYWVEEYHIDGVHLNSDVVPVEILASSPQLSRIKIMTEGFNLGRLYRDNKVPCFKNLAEYSDGFLVDIRRFLKGDEDQLNAIAYRLRRNPNQFGVINYIANHNGFNLMDMVSYDIKRNEANGENNRDGTSYNYSWNCGVEGPTRRKSVVELRKRQMKNALLLLLLGQGVPKLFGGDEIGFSQKGNNNPYCQDNEISWINWQGEKKQKELLDFTKKLITLRREHPILHAPKELKIMDYLSCGYPDLSYHGKKAWYPEFENYNRQIGIMYCGKYAKDKKGKEDDFIYIAYNMHWIEADFALPSLPKNKEWKVIIDTAADGEGQLKPVQRNIRVKERSIVVLIGK